jgi:hypothetical protein
VAIGGPKLLAVQHERLRKDKLTNFGSTFGGLVPVRAVELSIAPAVLISAHRA